MESSISSLEPSSIASSETSQSKSSQWFDFGHMLDLIGGDARNSRERMMPGGILSSTTTPSKSNSGGKKSEDSDNVDDWHDFSKEDIDELEMSALRGSLTLDPTVVWRKDLRMPAAQRNARTQVLEAISSVRGALSQIKYIGPDFGVSSKWGGGSRSPDGRIFFAPHTASHVLCINPFEGTMTQFGENLSSLFSNNHVIKKQLHFHHQDRHHHIHATERMFSDAIVGPNGDFLYLVPASSRYVVRLDLSSGETTPIGNDLGGHEGKWGKAVLCDELIYCAPYNSNRVLMIDPASNTTVLVGGELGGAPAKWGAPVVVPLGQDSSEDEVVIIFPPLNARNILAFNPSNKQTCFIGPDLGKAHFKYSGGCTGADGAVYFVPSCAARIIRVAIEKPPLGKSLTKKKAPTWKSSLKRLKKQREGQEAAAQGTTKPKLSLVDLQETSILEDLRASSKYPWPPKAIVSHHGPETEGFTYSSAILSPDGHTVFAIPLDHNFFMTFDTRSVASFDDAVKRVGPKLEPQRIRFGGAVLGLDGCIYCSPVRAPKVMRVDTLALAPHIEGTGDESSLGTFLPPPSSKAPHMGNKGRVSIPLSTKKNEDALSIPTLSWEKTSEVIYSQYLTRAESVKETKAPDISMAVIVAAVHWRKWAAARARESRGVSASDRVVGNNDKFMKSLLLHEPEVWCYGLTLENSSIPGDLSDWLAQFSNTDEGSDFVDSCGLEIPEDLISRVAEVPNLVFSLINVEHHRAIMRLPFVQRAIVLPAALRGDWLVRCLADRRLMEGAVEFIEILSTDLGIDKDDEDEERKRITFEQIASIDHLVSPMLRLPHRLQDRIASTELMTGVLDELFTERPLALLIISFEFFNIVALLGLILFTTWDMQHGGSLDLKEWFALACGCVMNGAYLYRVAINIVSMQRLGLSIGATKTLDILMIVAIFGVIGLSTIERFRTSQQFLIFASLTAGMCWLKLLDFLSGLHMEFAVYIGALIQITKGLRIFILTMAVIVFMFGNMFFVVLQRGVNDIKTNDDDDDDDHDLDDYDNSSPSFSTVESTLLTLFRMLLGDFDMYWYRKDGERLLTHFALFLFITYMIFVFIIMMNVLIAVVCDNYSFALSKSQQLFLRSRLATIGGLDMQGLTRKRNSQNSTSYSHETEETNDNLSNSNASPPSTLVDKFGDFFDRILKDTLWHRLMRYQLAIRGQTAFFIKSAKRSNGDGKNGGANNETMDRLEQYMEHTLEQLELEKEKRLVLQNQVSDQTELLLNISDALGVKRSIRESKQHIETATGDWKRPSSGNPRPPTSKPSMNRTRSKSTASKVPRSTSAVSPI